MSNPAVITLAETKTSFGTFRIEDNIGEAIHLHLGEFRYDLSIEEFNLLAGEINKAVEVLTKDIPGFNINQVSKEFYLKRATCWPDLISVEKDCVKLSELLVDTYDKRGRYTFLPLPNSRVLKALNGNPEENNNRNERNYFGQTNSDRLDAMLASIKENGYPKNNEYIVVFNNSNVIEDGQHRAACLYYLYGDISVDIIRMNFKDGKHTAVIRRPMKERLFKWNRDRVKSFYHRFCKQRNRWLFAYYSSKRERYICRNRKGK